MLKHNFSKINLLYIQLPFNTKTLGTVCAYLSNSLLIKLLVCFFLSLCNMFWNSRLKNNDKFQVDGNRVYVADRTCTEKRHNAMFTDADGSVTGTALQTITRNDPFLLTGDCKLRPNWNMAYCPHTYGVVCIYFFRGYVIPIDHSMLTICCCIISRFSCPYRSDVSPWAWDQRHDGEQHFCFLLGYAPVNR